MNYHGYCGYDSGLDRVHYTHEITTNHHSDRLEYKSVSYTMVYTPCFEEVYLHIRNQSSCLCPTSFLKAGLHCNHFFICRICCFLKIKINKMGWMQKRKPSLGDIEVIIPIM